MNGELRSLLAEAGYERAMEPDAWSSAVVLRNYGAVPPVSGLPPDTFLRNFKLLLLDRCGPAADGGFERESRLLEALSAAPALSRTVPHTRGACSPRLRLQLTDFVPGRSFANMVRSQDPASWARSACEIFEVSEAVTRCAEELLPGLLEQGDQVDLVDAAAPRLEVLGAAGIPAPYIEALRAAFSSVPPLRRRLQHGDLWPANALRYNGSWWLIDFADFGNAQVPMYDVFLFVHQTWRMLNLGTSADQWTAASRHVVTASADRLGLGPRQVAAAMTYYLVHLAAYRLGHGSDYVERAPFLLGVLRIAEALRDGSALEALPLPWEWSEPKAGSSLAPVSPPRD